jgi:hypothetical protein
VELNEIIAPPPASKHGTSTKCPFCPREDGPDYNTYHGDDNDSTKLTAVMIHPAALCTQQPGARPKDGGPAQQPVSNAKPKPDPIFTDGDLVYSCEAHHLISGKQALKGHSFERWIAAEKGEIQKDTGYSINNADNGLWAPSIPEEHKKGVWGRIDRDERRLIAFRPMEAGLPQFHKGNHAILDPDDPDQEIHRKYNEYLKLMLHEMDKRMSAWSSKCQLCDDTPKVQPSVRVNQCLDNLSRVVQRKISAPSARWEIFLSKFALEYHNTHCPHTGM